MKKASRLPATHFVIAFVLFASLLTKPASSQLLVNQDFTGGAVGADVTGAPVSWVSSGTGNGSFKIANANPVNYGCYNGGDGNYLSATKASSGTLYVGAEFAQTAAPTSSIYYSFLLNVSFASTTLSYFAGLSNSVGGSNYFARLWCQSEGTGYKLGISMTTTEAFRTSPTTLSLGTTYLVVVRYDFNPGSKDDAVHLWINPVLNSEPSVTSTEVSQVGSSSLSDATNWLNNGAFTLRNVVSSPSYFVDGIKVAYGTTSAAAWTALNASKLPAVPTATAGSNSSCTQFTANWSAVTNASAYLLDVSTASDFSSFVPGYTSLNVGNVTAYAVAGLAKGTTYFYRVRAINGSCISANSSTINYATATAPAITVAASASGVCYNATASQTASLTYSAVSGSAATYSIAWDALPVNNLQAVTDATLSPGSINILIPAATNAGTYTGHLTVKSANGCSSNLYNFTLIVSGVAAPAITITSQPTCSVSTGSFEVSSPTGIGYTYSINGADYTNATGIFTSLNPGTYSVTAKAASGCISASAIVNITAQPQAVNLQSSVVAAACNGSLTGAINLTVTNGVVASYNWTGPNGFSASTKDINGLAAGTYTVTATTTGGCISTTNAVVTQPDVLTAALISKTDSYCSGGSITVSAAGGTPAYTYVIAGPTVNTSGASTGVFTKLSAGTYTITVTDRNSCTSTISNIVVSGQAASTPDVSLAVPAFTDNFFPVTASSVTLLFEIREVNGSSALNDVLRVTNQSGYTLSLSTAASITLDGITYPIDNSRWTAANNGLFYNITINNGQQVNCGSAVYLAVVVTRNTSNKSVFTLTAQLKDVLGELPANKANNSATVLLVGQ